MEQTTHSSTTKITSLSIQQIATDGQQILKVTYPYGSFLLKTIPDQIKTANYDSVIWEWADSFSKAQLTQLICDILPASLKSLKLSGCMNIDDSHILAIIEKFRQIEELNVYYSGNEQWDISFYRQGLSAKNFRQRLKWSSKIIMDNLIFTKICQNFPPTLKKLSFKNIKLGGVTKDPVGTILKHSPNLVGLDISNTLITDNDLNQIDPNIANNFLINAKQLYLNRNRISKEGFLKLLGNKHITEIFYPLQIIQINDTTIDAYYSLIAKYFPNLKSLGINSLKLEHTEIEEVHSKQGFIWKNLTELCLNDHILILGDLYQILKATPNLTSLSLSGVQIQGQNKGQDLSMDLPLHLTKLNLTSFRFDQINLLVYHFIHVCHLQLLKLSNTKISCKLIDRIPLMENSKSIKYLEISFLDALCVQALPNFSSFQKQNKSLAQSCDLAVQYLIQRVIDNFQSLQHLQAYGLFLNSKFIDNDKKELLNKQCETRRVKVLMDQEGEFLWASRQINE